jgi:polygalacturonase
MHFGPNRSVLILTLSALSVFHPACSSGRAAPQGGSGGTSVTVGGVGGTNPSGLGGSTHLASAAGGSAGQAAGGAVNAGGANSATGTGGGPAASGGSGSSGSAGMSSDAGNDGSAGMSSDAGNGGGGSGGSSGSSDSGAEDPCGPQNPATVPLPVIGTGLFDVTAYGAVGDDKTDNTSALQKALSAAGTAGGGVVTVPAGTYLSGPLTLGSSTRIELAKGATLKMLPKASYPGATAFLTANNAHDIALTGAGTIEGQGQDWWTAFASDSSLARPQEVIFSNSTRVLISGVRFQNPPEEHIWVKGDKDLTITGITISTLAVSGKSPPKNTDGVDITADGVFFCNNSIECGDDNVAMSGSNIYLGYSTFGVGHGCSIGSITKNGVSKLTVDHLTMNGTTAGIRMKSARDRGGLAQDLTYSNITMTGVQNPIYITSYYPTMPTDPKADPAQAITSTTPEWQNITIKNVTITGSANAGILWGLPEAKISTVVFDNVHIQASTGMQVFHATGISFVGGSTVTPKSGAAVTTYDADVTGIATVAY